MNFDWLRLNTLENRETNTEWLSEKTVTLLSANKHSGKLMNSFSVSSKNSRNFSFPDGSFCFKPSLRSFKQYSRTVESEDTSLKQLCCIFKGFWNSILSDILFILSRITWGEMRVKSFPVFSKFLAILSGIKSV